MKHCHGYLKALTLFLLPVVSWPIAAGLFSIGDLFSSEYLSIASRAVVLKREPLGSLREKFLIPGRKLSREELARKSCG